MDGGAKGKEEDLRRGLDLVVQWQWAGRQSGVICIHSNFRSFNLATVQSNTDIPRTELHIHMPKK